MSEHDVIPPETDDEIRDRYRVFAQQVAEHTDTEAALQRMPGRRSVPPTGRLLAIAAGLLVVLALAALVTPDRQSVDTVPADSPATDCPSTTRPRAITEGAQMNKRFAAPVASAATAILLLSACSDDDSSGTSGPADKGPTTLAKGEDVEFVGDGGFSTQTLSIDVVEEDGKVTGEFSVSDVIFVRVDCADTDTPGVVIIGGTITKGDPTHLGDAGDLLVLTIREGVPDRAAIGNNPLGLESCTELVKSVRREDFIESDFVETAYGHDIETG
jgi:hypothetical protein